LLVLAFAALLFTDARYAIQNVFSLAGSWLAVIAIFILLGFASFNYPR